MPDKKKPRKDEGDWPGPRKTSAGLKMKRGKADRSRIAGNEPYEVYYVARKFGVSADTVRKVIKRVGNSRKKVYYVLEKAKS